MYLKAFSFHIFTLNVKLQNGHIKGGRKPECYRNSIPQHSVYRIIYQYADIRLIIEYRAGLKTTKIQKYVNHILMNTLI